jgi:HSP20 family protein
MGDAKMPARKRDFFDEIHDMSAGMERLFYRFFHPILPLKMLSEPTWQPLTDICETDGAFIVKMDLAGVRATDVDIRVENDRLVVSGVRPERPAAGIKAHHQMEINYGRFERIILLRARVSQDQISASYDNGFLTITIPKRLPYEDVTRVEILNKEG